MGELKESSKDATNPSLQDRLVRASQEVTVPAMELVAATKRILPKIGEVSTKHDLKTASDSVAEELQKMMNALKTLAQEGISLLWY